MSASQFGFIILLILSEPIFAKESLRSVIIDIKINEVFETNLQNANINHSLSDLIDATIEDAEVCLNKAFIESGIKNRLSLIRGNIYKISQQEESKLSSDGILPSYDANGSIIVGDISTEANNVVLSVSSSFEDTHVPFVASSAYLTFVNNDGFEQVEDLNKRWDDFPKERHLIISEYENLTKDILVISNRINFVEWIFINGLKTNIEPENSTGVILAHELMHAWGGLKDEYGHHEGLMSSFECMLSAQSTKNLVKNRNLELKK